MQLDLTGVSAAEIMDAQRAIETLAAELAAEHATDGRSSRGSGACSTRPTAIIDDTPAYTRSCRDFHLAVAEASHNRVLVMQLISLQHVSWPRRNRTLTPQGRAPHPRRAPASSPPDRDARRRRRAPPDGRPRQDDPRPARRRARQELCTSAAERDCVLNDDFGQACEHQGRRPWRNHKFIIQPHFRLQEWVAEEKGYFTDEGLDYEFRETVQSSDGKSHAAGRQGRRDADLREGPQVGHQLRLPLDRQRRGRQGPRQAVRRRLLGVAVRHLRAGGFQGEDAGGPRRRADLGRLPVGQPLLDHPGARAVHAAGPDQAVVHRRHAVRPHGAADRRQDPGLHAVLRPVLLRRAARLPQGASTAPS